MRYNCGVPAASQNLRVKVTVLFFGRLKEITGSSDASVDLLPGSDIEALFGDFAARFPLLKSYRTSTVPSRNQEFAAWNTPLRSGDEIAFLPPVSGG